MSPRRGGGLLRPQGRRTGSRAPAGSTARPARSISNNRDEHADHDRARHGIRKTRVRPHGARLMAGLRGKALVAYLVVCVFWGSTYLAIRVGVGVLPPFLFAGLRFLVAGALLAALALALGDRLPRRSADWKTLSIVGVLLLGGGNAFVVWAEQYT